MSIASPIIRNCRQLLTLVLLASAFAAGCSGKTRDELYAEGMKRSGDDPAAAVLFFRKALEKDQNYTAARFELASAYLRTRKLEQAEKELQKVLLQTPSHPEARLSLAMTFNLMKKPEKTIELLAQDEVSPVDRKNDLLGSAYFQKGMNREARSAFEKALEVNPANLQARLHLAAVHQTTGDLAGARRLLEELAAREPGNVEALLALAALEKRQGNAQKALAIYARAYEQDAENPRPLYEKGVLHLQLKEAAKADEVIALLQQKFPKRPETMKLKGLDHYGRGKFAEAVTELQSAVKVQPTVDSFYYLGLSLYGKGELETAMSHFRRIVDVDPDFRQARLLIAMTLIRQKRLDDAMSELRKILEKNPRDAGAHNLLGTVFMEKRMFDEGMRELNVAAELDPTLVEAHLKKGMYRVVSGRPTEAEADFLAALRAGPDLLSSRMLLAQYYARAGKPEKASGILRSGLKGGKEDALLYEALAVVAASAKKDREALELLGRAKQADPALGDPYFALASYHISRGDSAAAQREYDQLLAVDSKNLKGLIAAGALQEMNRNEQAARSFFERGAATGSAAGQVALSAFEMRRNDPKKALAVLEAAIKGNPRN
ncbi:MAG TPA: XrtA/PEP-CTERM system TPR-repeat protein PrsT, partial [Verrucomicrobiae bacterium]|nr:XrtA/PEP-CTERM system TPR-repeat protein PrsT [Verrucomicrobiae bacterium]